MTPQPFRYLRLDEVIAATGLSRSTLYQAMHDGEFPAARQLTKRAVGWRSDEVEAWLASRPPVGGSVGVSGESSAA